MRPNHLLAPDDHRILSFEIDKPLTQNLSYKNSPVKPFWYCRRQNGTSLTAPPGYTLSLHSVRNTWNHSFMGQVGHPHQKVQRMMPKRQRDQKLKILPKHKYLPYVPLTVLWWFTPQLWMKILQSTWDVKALIANRVIDGDAGELTICFSSIY